MQNNIDNYFKYKNGELVVDNNKPLDCVLNMTNIVLNKNKFYILQLIKLNNKYIRYVRYGRIGETRKCFYVNIKNKDDAIKSFKKQFKSKTGNDWVATSNTFPTILLHLCFFFNFFINILFRFIVVIFFIFSQSIHFCYKHIHYLYFNMRSFIRKSMSQSSCRSIYKYKLSKN